jgi:hypothetical protein
MFLISYDNSRISPLLSKGYFEYDFELIASTYIDRNEFTLTPFALLGINEGFVFDEYKGLNNLQLGFEASTPIFDSMELRGYIAYTIALAQVPQLKSADSDE